MAFIYGAITKCKVKSGQTRNEYECRFGYQVNGQSIESNTSNVTLRLEVRSISSSYATYGANQTSTIDGGQLSAQSFDMRNTNVWQVFGERTITVIHNAEGKYSQNKSGSFVTTASSSNYSLKSGSAEVQMSLPDIPRASQPSLVTLPETTQNVTIGSTIQIHMNQLSDSFTHNVRYYWGNKWETIATGIKYSCNWNIPLHFCEEIGNSNSGTGTITVDTYSGNELVGTKSVNFTGIVPNDIVPVITGISVSEANGNVSGLGCYVQSKSQLRIQTAAHGRIWLLDNSL